MRRLPFALLTVLALSVCILGQSTVYWKKDFITDASGNVVAIATPAPADQTPPTAPSGLTCLNTSMTVELSWTGSTDGGSGMAGYKIFRGSLPVATTTTATAFTDFTIQPNSPYVYTIVAVDNAGNHSSASGTCSFTSWPGPWRQVGGNEVLHSWPVLSALFAESMHSFDGKLYTGMGTTGNAAMLFEFNPESQRWRKMGGGDWITTGSWGAGYEAVTDITDLDGKLYAGLGIGSGDAEVWQLNVSTLVWTKVGGDGVNSSWTGFDTVSQLTTLNGKLYAGLGQSGNNAAVWEYDPSTGTWTQTGGTAPWPAGRETVRALTSMNGKLYAGLGDTGSDAAVWQWDPATSTWTKIGDTGSAPFPNSREQVQSLAALDGKLYAGLGTTASDGAVWQWNPSTPAWTKVGGDGVNGSWATGANIESVRSLTGADGKLYAGLGSSFGDAEIWRFMPSTTSWTKVGGDSLDSSWAAAASVSALQILDGELAAATTSGDIWLATPTEFTDQTEETIEESDTFDYAAGAIGTITAPWSLRGTAGSWSVTSATRLRFTASGTSTSNWRGAIHDWTGPASPPTVLFAQVVFEGASGSWGNGGAGPGVRYASSSGNDEVIAFERMRVNGTTNYQNISRRPPTGAPTDLWTSSSSLIASGDVMRIEVWHGSIAITRRNGTAAGIARFVPTAGGLMVGMVGQSNGSGSPGATLDFDNWQAGIID
jgi:hypothetical protein